MDVLIGGYLAKEAAKEEYNAVLGILVTYAFLILKAKVLTSL